MNKTVTLVLRIILGAGLLFFGLNKFLNFMQPPMPEGEDIAAYWQGLMATKTLMVVAVVEVLTGLSLLLNKYASLMLVIMMPIAVCMVLYHLTLDPGGIGGAAMVFIFNLVLLFAHKDRYEGMLKA